MNSTSISDKQSIITFLSEAVDHVNSYLEGLNRERFEFAPTGKWNAGQQLDHLLRSIKPLNLAYALPGFLLNMMFGKANRPSKSYDGLVDKYEAKLALGGRASGRFVPVRIPYENRQKFVNDYNRQKEKLIKKVSRFKESNLDKYILPHPLLGKLTLREMLFFTIHHNRHHLNLIKKYLETF